MAIYKLSRLSCYLMIALLAVVFSAGCANPFDGLDGSSGDDGSGGSSSGGTWSYTVSFDSQGADTEADPPSMTVDSPDTTVGSLPGDPEKDGYHFGGWWSEENGAGDEFTAGTEVTGDMTVYAHWSQIPTYTVSFDTGGGSAVDSQTIQQGSLVTEPAEPEKTGYLFGGWYADDSFNTVWDFGTDTIDGDTTIYARWADYSYTVSFDSQDADTEADPPSMTVDSPDTIVGSLPGDPEKAGYHFGGWWSEENGGGDEFTAVTEVTGDITVYAHWSQIPTYTVSFDSQGGSPTPEDQTVEDGDSAALPAEPSRSGYAFTGWFTEASGGAQWNFADAITEEKTLYAQWEINQYTVSFNSQGGSPTPEDQTVEHGDSAALPAEPSRSGYEFTGWFTEASGGAQWNFADAITEEKTLYAQWEINQYTVSFNSQGGSPTPEDQTVEHGDSAALPAEPSRGGYEFTGWFTEASGGAQWNFADAITEEKTLHAQWEELPAYVHSANWTSSGSPGSHGVSDVESGDGSEGVRLYWNADNSGYEGSWVYSTEAEEDGTITIAWELQGQHSWHQAEAHVELEVVGGTTTVLFSGDTYGSFSASGTESFTVEAGQTWRINVSGSHFDSGERLRGNFEIYPD